LKRAFEKFGSIDRIDLKEGRGFGFIVGDLIHFCLFIFYYSFSTIKNEEMQNMQFKK